MKQNKKLKKKKQVNGLMIKNNDDMEKIQCPVCNYTLLYASYIKGQIKCQRCKKIIDIKKEKSNEHIETKQVLK